MDLIAKLNVILAEHAHTRVNGKVASERTASAAGEALRSCFRKLLALGYKLENPRNIGENHIRVLCEEWHRIGRKPKTIQGYLSQLRIFCGWIGKGGLVKDAQYYLPNVPREDLRVASVTRASKSWAEMGIDVAAKAREAMSMDERFGLMILSQVAFGLRRMETLQMQPWKNDMGNKFAAKKTKGGRPRDVYIDTPVQRQVLDLIKERIGKTDHLGWSTRHDNGKPASLKYSKRRYNHLMERLGITKEMAEVTGHGLRAQFAENDAILKNLIPATLGGSAGQMEKEDMNVARLKISESLGHSRISVTGAYIGSFGRDTSCDEPDHVKNKIEAGLDALGTDQVKAVLPERRIDCAALGVELQAIEVYTDPRKIQALWEDHSRRHAVDWLPPTAKSNLAALIVAANRFAAKAGDNGQAG